MIKEFEAFESMDVKVVVYCDDVELRIVSVYLFNYSGKELYAQVNRITPPKKEYHVTLPSGNEVSFDLPNGFDYTVVPQYDEFGVGVVSYSFPEITTYMRLG